MTGPRRFHALVLATGVVSVLGFSVAEQLPLLAMLVVAAAFVGPMLKSPLPRISLNLLVLAATANAAMSVLRDRQELISHLTTYLSLILIVKIFDRGRMRDEAQLLGLSIFIIIGSVLTGQSFLLGILLLIYTVMAMAAVVLYQIYSGEDRRVRTSAEAGHRPGEEEQQPPAATRRQLAGTISVCLALSLAAAVVSFIITPRGIVQQFIGNVGRVGGGASTGFRESIQLGTGGYINVSREPVMDLLLRDGDGQLIRSRPEVLYLRGAVLSHYDSASKQWTERAEGTSLPSHNGGRRGSPERLGSSFGVESSVHKDNPDLPGGGSGNGRIILRQEVVIRNARTPRSPAFAAWRPVRFWREGSQPYVFDRSQGILYTNAGGRLTYTVDSMLDYRNADPESAPSTDLQGAFKTGPIAGLARRIAAEAAFPLQTPTDDPAVLRRLATTVIADLRRRCVYSLENPPPDSSADPLEFFLFESKRGHCEYFACAMVAILQSLDVEARVVTGYAASEFNPVNDHYTVRQSDAHAWVEVRISPERWETFDPTPPSELQAAQRAGDSLWSRIRQAWDAIEFSWIDNVVSYDRGMQVDLLSLTGSRSHDTTLLTLRDRIQATIDAVKDLIPAGSAKVAGIILAAFAAAAALMSLTRTGRIRLSDLWRNFVNLLRVRRAQPDPRFTPETEFYRRMLSLLEVARLAKPEAVPPLAHARSLSQTDPALSELAADTAAAYYRIRFGRQHAPPAEIEALTRRLDAAEQSLARPGR